MIYYGYTIKNNNSLLVLCGLPFSLKAHPNELLIYNEVHYADFSMLKFKQIFNSRL